MTGIPLISTITSWEKLTPGNSPVTQVKAGYLILTIILIDNILTQPHHQHSYLSLGLASVNVEGSYLITYNFHKYEHKMFPWLSFLFYSLVY